MQLGDGHGAIVLTVYPIFNSLYASGSSLDDVSILRHEQSVEQVVGNHVNSSGTINSRSGGLGEFVGGTMSALCTFHGVGDMSTESLLLVQSSRSPGKQMAAVVEVSSVTSTSSALSLTTCAASSGTMLQVVVGEFGVADEMSTTTDASASPHGHSDEQVVGTVAARSGALKSTAVGETSSVVVSRSTVEISEPADGGVVEPPTRYS